MAVADKGQGPGTKPGAAEKGSADKKELNQKLGKNVEEDKKSELPVGVKAGINKLSQRLEAKVEGKDQVPAVTGSKPTDMFSEFMKRHQRDFEMVVPKHLSPERVMRVAIAACKRNPELMKCWLPSVVGGCLEASALGLEINTPLHQCYLIPFKNNTTKRTEAELIIGYEGYIELMYNNPKVLSVFYNVVYKNDTFRYAYGTEEYMEHIELEHGDRGEIRGFYAYARMTDGAYRFVYVPKQEADRVRDEYSQSYKMNPKESPWVTDYVAMGCKTAIRKLQKVVPKSAECARAVEADFKVIDPFDPNYVGAGEAEDKPPATGKPVNGKEQS